jgi:hypothetical protein
MRLRRARTRAGAGHRHRRRPEPSRARPADRDLSRTKALPLFQSRWPSPDMAEDRVEPEGGRDGAGRRSVMAFSMRTAGRCPHSPTAYPGPDPGSLSFTRPLRHSLITRATRRRRTCRPHLQRRQRQAGCPHAITPPTSLAFTERTGSRWH